MKKKYWLYLGLLLLLFGAVGIAVLEPFTAWLNSLEILKTRSIGSAVVLVLAVVAQILVAFLPGEPIEILAGVVFGSWLGLLLCLLGAFLGSVLVYVLVKRMGLLLVRKLFKQQELGKLHFLKKESHLFATLFTIFLIPGVPKDLLTYVMPLTSLSFGQFLLVTTIARIPSIITSTIGGDLVAKQNYIPATIVFVLTMILAFCGMKYYHTRTKKAAVIEK